MKKYDDSLFQIGAVTKILGVTRKTLLVYEDLGLLTPAVKDADSGFRYYTADNMTQIRSIRSLQALGLSLKEIAEYYYDTKNMDLYLQRLCELCTLLDKNIQFLQVRAAKQGDLTVHPTTLPRQVCYAQRAVCQTVGEAAIQLRNTYIAVARTGMMSLTARMFTVRMTSDPEKLDLLYCIPYSTLCYRMQMVPLSRNPLWEAAKKFVIFWKVCYHKTRRAEKVGGEAEYGSSESASKSFVPGWETTVDRGRVSCRKRTGNRQRHL